MIDMTVLTLPFPISVNAMFADGLSRRVKSQRYYDWIVEAGYALNRQHPPQIFGQVELKYEVEEKPDKIRRDVENYAKGVSDLLVKHKVILADDNTVVRKITMEWNPLVKGVRITISPVGLNRVPETSQTESSPHERATSGT
jgi:Holliday junction resolvase RusA-like endonuclease